MPRMILLLALFCTSFFAEAQHGKPYVDSLKRLLDTTHFDTVRMRCLIKLGVFYEGENPKVAEDYLLRAYNLKLSPNSSDLVYRSMSASYLGKIYGYLGDTAASYSWNMKALQHVAQTTDPMARFLVWDNASNWYLERDRYDSALYFSQRVTDMWEQLNQPEQAAAGYFSTGNIFEKMHQYQKAIGYIRKSMQMAGIDERGSSPFLIPILQSLAELHVQTGRYDSVLYFATKLYPIALSETYYDGVIDALALKAQALMHLNRPAEAGVAAHEAYALAIANEHTGKMQVLSGALAVSFAATGQTDSAQFYAKQAERFYKKSASSKAELADLHRMWAGIYAAQGNWKLAYEYKEKELAAFTAFKSEELSAVTAQQEVAYQTGKKEKTITKLSAENEAGRKIQWLTGIGLLLAVAAAGFAFMSYSSKKKAARVLEQSNREKDVFLKEIHHRVKNNLQIISSLLYMQFRDQKDEAMVAKLKQAQERIKSMALVHNKLYEAEDVVHVYLKEYMADLAAGILASNVPPGKKISLNIEADRALQLSLDTSISLGLMLNEVLTNACKYAFQNQHAGTISIRLDQLNDSYRLEVRDDGSGLPADFETKNTLGTRLVKNLARQLGGTVHFETNNGTLVTIAFKNQAAA